MIAPLSNTLARVQVHHLQETCELLLYPGHTSHHPCKSESNLTPLRGWLLRRISLVLEEERPNKPSSPGMGTITSSTNRPQNSFSNAFRFRVLRVYLEDIYNHLPTNNCQLINEVNIIHGSLNQDFRRELQQVNWVVKKYSRFSENNRSSVCTAETSELLCRFIYSNHDSNTNMKCCFSYDSCRKKCAFYI